MNAPRGPRVVLVTAPEVSLDEIVRVATIATRAVPPGALAVQLRDKNATAEELAAAVRALGAAPVIVNGADLATSLEAAQAGAAGVHVAGAGLERRDVARARAVLGPNAIVSAAAHDDDDVAWAARDGASLVLVSPVFATPGKATPRGTAAITSACAVLERAGSRARVAVIALGGVTPENARACKDAGADGVAAIRAFFVASSDDDLEGVVRSLALPFSPGS